MDIAAFLDSTDLRADASAAEIEALCREAVQLNMAAVCVHPYRLKLAQSILGGSGVKLCTVIGFPLGAEGLESKVYAAEKALAQGADELDMVINIGAVKDEDYFTVMREIEAVLALKSKYRFLLKAIVETALLTGPELATLTIYLSQAGADFIKTSTGFAARGVNLEDIEIIKGHREETLKIKASGGIRDLNFALELIEAGVERLGTSAAGQLVQQYRLRKNP
ncbi:MAG: deoxyribose-phosphate aldolase [Syntrophomonadaceae bacterium]|nr:deoxyribose-phosphate aldolase [Syntrophomonadaceae bacterium]